MTFRRQLSIAFQTNKKPAEYQELARLVEGYGFDVLSMYSDLTFQPPIVPLTLAAMATSRIRLGPASLNPFLLHPIEIAGQIAALDMVSNGRAYLGLSRGAWLDAVDVSHQQPIARIVDTIHATNHLLSRSAEEFRGRTFALRSGVRLNYQPTRSVVPKLIGAWGPKMIARTATLVDEIKLGGAANPDIVPIVKSWLADLALDREPGIVLGAVTIVDEDGEAARAQVKREMAIYLPVVAPLDPTIDIDRELLDSVRKLVDRGDVENAGRIIPDYLVDKFAFAGTPQAIVDQCEAIFDAGAARIEFGTPHGMNTNHGLHLLGDFVLPALSKYLTSHS